MRRAPIVTLLLALMATGVMAQNPKGGGQILTFTPPDPTSPVPGELLRKLPIQIILSCKVNGRPLPQTVTGTGFIVGVPVPPAEKNLSFDYLVTNRHVAECWDATNHPQEVASIATRINQRNGEAATLQLNGSGNVNWFFPDDDSVDLAVTGFSLPSNMEWDVAALGFSEFATRDSLRQHRIGEGSTVAVTGVFVQFPGQRKFQPILRQGTLSMIPDEPMVTTTGKLGTVYLADVHVFGGNSGSPVLASPQDDMIHAGQRWFIGLVSGYYSETENSKMEIAVTVNAETQANSGVAMIVPADEVKKLIENNPILKSSRDAYLATLPKENPSAPHTP